MKRRELLTKTGYLPGGRVRDTFASPLISTIVRTTLGLLWRPIPKSKSDELYFRSGVGFEGFSQ